MKIRCPTGGASRPATPTAAVSGDLMSVRASTSDLPRLKIDAWIDPGVREIGDQIHHYADQRKDIERGEHHRIIAVEHALEAKQTEAVERENALDQQRAGEEGVHEGRRKSGDNDQHSVAEHVSV